MTGDKNVATENGWNKFLDDATHAIKKLWESRKGHTLTTDELYDINDALTELFGDKRPEK